MSNFEKKLLEKMAQVYCLRQHRKKTLDAKLIEDMIAAVKCVLMTGLDKLFEEGE